MTGTVYLVGAGPGAPDLITVRGRDLLGGADVVVHDRLVSTALLAWCRPGAEIIDAGKAPGRAPLDQAGINGILVERARAGRTVVRLKGGDPFVFGRGGEELAACARAGVPCQVVPGVSSAVAAPALAGIPVTWRGVSRSFAVVTGHAAPVSQGCLVAADTLVVLMGMGRLSDLVGDLVAAGRSPDAPAAVVSRASWPDQMTAVATLGSIARAAATAGCASPGVLVVGEVVAHRHALAG